MHSRGNPGYVLSCGRDVSHGVWDAVPINRRPVVRNSGSAGCTGTLAGEEPARSCWGRREWIKRSMEVVPRWNRCGNRLVLRVPRQVGEAVRGYGDARNVSRSLRQGGRARRVGRVARGGGHVQGKSGQLMVSRSKLTLGDSAGDSSFHGRERVKHVSIPGMPFLA